MSANFDATCRKAIDLAKSTLPDGAELAVEHLLAALYHASALKERLPQVGRYLPAPESRHAPPDKVPVSEGLKPILNQLTRDGQVVTADALFAALVRSPSGKQILNRNGMPESEWQALAAAVGSLGSNVSGPGWRDSPERDQAMRALAPFGRMLTAVDLPDRGTAEMDQPLQMVVRSLMQMRRRAVILLGHPGTGKSALVYELGGRKGVRILLGQKRHRQRDPEPFRRRTGLPASLSRPLRLPRSGLGSCQQNSFP